MRGGASEIQIFERPFFLVPVFSSKEGLLVVYFSVVSRWCNAVYVGQFPRLRTTSTDYNNVDPLSKKKVCKNRSL